MGKKKKSETSTSSEGRIAVLADLWINYRNDEEFADFVEYNDLGLPLAYAIDAGIVASTELAMSFIDETFELLLDALDVEDIGFEDFEEILERAKDD